MPSIRFTDARPLRRAAIGALLWLSPLAAMAHSPHHIITDLAVEAVPGGEADVFILITDQVFRSESRNQPWKNLDNGLDIRHPYVAVALSPDYTDDHSVYVATSGDGVFHSTDRGDSWRRINDGLGTVVLSDLIAFGEDDGGHRLLAAGENGGLWLRAHDNGRWQEVLAPHVAVTALAPGTSGAGEDGVFAGDADGRVWHSSDGGELWRVIANLDKAGAITSIALDGQRLFAGTSARGIYVAEGLDAPFRRLESFAPVRTHDCRGRELDEPVPDRHVTSITASPASAEPGTLYVTTWYGAVFVSNDTGSTWDEWSDGLSCDVQAASEGLPHFSTIAFGDPTDEVAWLAAFDGLFRAESRGGQWHQLETLPLGLIKGFAIDTAGTGEPAVALATYGGGFYVTKDLGRSWIIGNRGLVTTRLTGIAFSPEESTDSRIYAGASQRLLWSDDDGRHWHRVMLQEYGLGSRIAFKLWSWGMSRRLTRVLHDPREHALVYPTHIVARTRPSTGRVYFATRFHGVMAFEPASGEVESVWGGTEKIMNTFEASPDFSRDGALIGSIRGEGLVRSTDRGQSWQPINAGLEFVDEWKKTPEGTNFRRDVQIAFSPKFGADGTLFAGSPGASGLYRSDDRGRSWQEVDLLPDVPAVPVLAIALSPRFSSDGTMLVSVKGHGLYRSVDRGRTFEPVGDELRRGNASVEFLAFSGRYPGDGVAVAASDEALFSSRDGGVTWQETSRPVRYEDMRDVVRFSSGWTEQNSAEFSALTERRASSAGASASVEFFGTGVRWVGSVGPGFGAADVIIDGELVDSVTADAPRPAPLQTLFTVDDLPFGRHVIEIRVSPDIGAGPVAVDAFDILGSGGAAH